MTSSYSIPRFSFYQNCYGLRTKLTTLKCNVACIDYLFLIFTEIWLHSGISSSKLGLTGYTIYRFDRSPLTSTFMRGGGGVLITIRNDIPSSLLHVPFMSID